MTHRKLYETQQCITILFGTIFDEPVFTTSLTISLMSTSPLVKGKIQTPGNSRECLYSIRD